MDMPIGVHMFVTYVRRESHAESCLLALFGTTMKVASWLGMSPPPEYHSQRIGFDSLPAHLCLLLWVVWAHLQAQTQKHNCYKAV